MTWTEQVHSSRLQAVSRAPVGKFGRQAATPPNSGAFPILLVSAVLSSVIWWGKEGRKLRGRASPLSWLGDTVKRLTTPDKKPPKQLGSNWKQHRPGALAAEAAERRLQGTEPTQSGPTNGDSQRSKSKKKKKKNKK